MNCSIDDMITYKKNALDILRRNSQFATASVVEDLFNREILYRQVESGADIKQIIMNQDK